MPPVAGLWSMPGVHQVATSAITLSRGSFMLLIHLSPSYSIYMVDHTAMEIGSESLNTSAFPTWWEGSSFPSCVPPMKWSTLNMWLVLKHDSGVVTAYQVDKFTHT